MKKPRPFLMFTFETLLFLAGVYFEPTHAVRGRLHGDAFFDGKPTSYWRARIDGWQDRFDSAHDAEECLRAMSWEGLISSTAIIFTPPPPTFWNRTLAWVGMKVEDDSNPPAVLSGDPDAEPVLRELERDIRYRRLIDLARRNARFRPGAAP